MAMKLDSWSHFPGSDIIRSLRPEVTPADRDLYSRSAKDITFYTSKLEYEVSKEDSEGSGTYILKYGVTEEGYSSCVKVRKFFPFFAISCPDTVNGENMIYYEEDMRYCLDRRLREELNRSERKDIESAKRNASKFSQLVQYVNVKRGRPYTQYQDDESLFAEVHVSFPALVPVLKKLLGMRIMKDWLPSRFYNTKKMMDPVEVFEADIEYTCRYIASNERVPDSWYTIDKSKYKLCTGTSKETICKLEVWVDYHDIRYRPDLALKLPRLVVMSIDTEWLSPRRKLPGGGTRMDFPTPQTATLLCTCMTFYVLGNESEMTQVTIYNGQLEEPEEVITYHTKGAGKKYPSMKVTCKVRNYSMENEQDTIDATAEMIRLSDPDELTGYNLSFDYPMLLNRAKHLAYNGAPRRYNTNNETIKGRVIGRTKDRESNVGKKQKFESSAHIFQRETFPIPGRVEFCMLDVINRDYKLRSYTLNSVSINFLGDTKEEVNVNLLELMNKSLVGRRKIKKYCLKDSFLPIALAIQLSTIPSKAEVARCTGLPRELVVKGGMQKRTSMLLLRKSCGSKEGRDYFPTKVEEKEEEDRWTTSQAPPPKRKKRDPGYKGAVVQPPKPGYYADEYEEGNPEKNTHSATASFDVSSMYPSIVISGNICRKTYVSLADLPKYIERNGWVEGVHYTIPPDFKYDSAQNKFEKLAGKKHAFVTPKVRKGLAPQILENTLAKRAEVKNMLKTPMGQPTKGLPGEPPMTEPLWKALNLLQEVIKAINNSVYGSLGAPHSKIYHVGCAEIVTQYGRFLITIGRYTILKKYSKENGCKYKLDPLYGDTDSLLIYISGFEKLEDIFAFCDEVVNTINSVMLDGVVIVFEKYYDIFILYAKKKYAGRSWVKGRDGKPAKPSDGHIVVKGMEAVRRDNCKLAAEAQTRVFDILLNGGKVSDAEQYVRDVYVTFRRDEISYSKLVISKQLKKSPEEYEVEGKKPPDHALLARHLQKTTGVCPPVGERMQYVMVECNRKDPTAVPAQVPITAWEQQMKLDVNYYIEKQIVKPMTRVFAPIYCPGQSIHIYETKEEEDTGDQYDKKKAGKKNKKDKGKEREIAEVVYKRLFLPVKGSVVRSGTHVSSTFSRFAVADQCTICKSTDVNQGEAFCKACLSQRDLSQEIDDLSRDVESLNLEYTKRWMTCQDCMKCEEASDIDCMDTECDEFWDRRMAMRKKVKAQEKLEKMCNQFSAMNIGYEESRPTNKRTSPHDGDQFISMYYNPSKK